MTALAGRLGGIAALDPRTGEVRALAGIAFSAPQPPGSTFKIVTTAAALEAEAWSSCPTSSRSRRAALIDGVDARERQRRVCGGTFADSFAHSCNSVFAPLGVKVGAERLVETAERFGWNAEPRHPRREGRARCPAAGEIVTPLEVGSTAIGQCKVLATPLQMASVAQTIANDGVRQAPTLAAGRAPKPRPGDHAARSPRTIEELMVGVVELRHRHARPRSPA